MTSNLVQFWLQNIFSTILTSPNAHPQLQPINYPLESIPIISPISPLSQNKWATMTTRQNILRAPPPLIKHLLLSPGMALTHITLSFWMRACTLQNPQTSIDRDPKGGLPLEFQNFWAFKNVTVWVFQSDLGEFLVGHSEGRGCHQWYERKNYFLILI